jgi:MYXO-CTERM domain-containing protein
MKQFGAEAGGQRSLPSWASRLAFTSAVAALALIAAPGAKADVRETFNLSGNFFTLFGSLVPFSGTIDLDFTNDFTSYTASGNIMLMLPGHSVFDQALSLTVSPSLGTITGSNSVHDTLALWFAAPESGTWAGFNAGDVSFGDVTFGAASGFLFNATGEVTRDLSNPAILDPPPPIIDPPPPITGPPDPPTLAVPELSTWAMLLLGLAGLGLAAKRRRALGFLGGKA